MALLLFAGTLLLAVWTWWTFYIADRQPEVSVSLLLQVQQGEEYLDPFLRHVLHIFRRSAQLRLRDIWILAKDDGEHALRIVQRLDAEYPLFQFRPRQEPEQLDFAQADGQILLFLDLVNRLTPVTALQAVNQLLMNGPTPPGTAVLPTSG